MVSSKKISWKVLFKYQSVYLWFCSQGWNKRDQLVDWFASAGRRTYILYCNDCALLSNTKLQVNRFAWDLLIFFVFSIQLSVKRHKVKLIPGTTKKGQGPIFGVFVCFLAFLIFLNFFSALKTAIEIFTRDKTTSQQEKDLIKSLKVSWNTRRFCRSKAKVAD